MGIFSRMGDIINSNLNAMIDKAEDPEKIARLIIQEMEDTLVELRTDAARNIAERKEVSRNLENYRKRAAEWGKKAELAITKDREDLARGALQARRQAENMAAVVEQEIEILDEAVAKADADLAKLQARLDEVRAKHRALMMRSSVARNRIRVRSRLSDHKVDDALTRYRYMERRVDELEAQVEAFDLGVGESLEGQFAQMEADEAIENELEALKKGIHKGSKKSETSQAAG
ncbi:MAG: phage shock protein PspA [Hyphomonadaceae bacterium]|nr:phage shock protein PspA [Hyphomonadaceae bacterium]MBC6413060.1 phage shock protein PspA [Hyphomonadaceae bacterium]